jgi:transposase InsO family protein
MSKARLVITAIEVEGRTPAEVIAAYGFSRSWVYELLKRYRAEGEAVFEPRSRRPHKSPRATPPATVELVLHLRKQLSDTGLDAGADTLAWHLAHHHQTTLSRATIHRILTRAGAVTPQPAKRPKTSYIRFAAEQPNETWQSDVTHYRLATGADTEIITWLDDHSRLALHVSVHPRITGPIVLATFRQAAELHGHPASTLTDNGMVYTTRFAGGRGGRTGLETELARRGIVQKNSRPNHPTPATAYGARPKAGPGADLDTHHRVRTDKIDQTGCVTLRLAGRLHHIGIGRTHYGTHVLLLVQDLHVRVIDAATGELLRELTIDPTRDYQPTGRPPGTARK